MKVVEFSKKTGDYASLSMPDLKVLALTHMLAVRAGGADAIPKEPKKTRPTGHLPSAPPPKPRYNKKPEEQEEAPVEDDGWETAKPKKAARKIRYTTRQCKQDLSAEDSAEQSEEVHEEGQSVAAGPGAPEGADNAAERLEELSLQEPKQEGAEALEEHPQEEQETSGEVEVEDSDDDGSEWITPENIKEHRAMEIGVTPEELQAQTKIDVACMTNDFAMQVNQVLGARYMNIIVCINACAHI